MFIMEIRSKRIQLNKGFTLVEVIIAMIILALLTVSATTLFSNMRRLNNASVKYQQGIDIASSILEYIGNLPYKDIDNSSVDKWSTYLTNDIIEYQNSYDYDEELDGKEIKAKKIKLMNISSKVSDYQALITITPTDIATYGSKVNENKFPNITSLTDTGTFVLSTIGDVQFLVDMDGNYLTDYDASNDTTSYKVSLDSTFDVMAMKEYADRNYQYVNDKWVADCAIIDEWNSTHEGAKLDYPEFGNGIYNYIDTAEEIEEFRKLVEREVILELTTENSFYNAQLLFKYNLPDNDDTVNYVDDEYAEVTRVVEQKSKFKQSILLNDIYLQYGKTDFVKDNLIIKDDMQIPLNLFLVVQDTFTSEIKNVLLQDSTINSNFDIKYESSNVENNQIVLYTNSGDVEYKATLGMNNFKLPLNSDYIKSIDDTNTTAKIYKTNDLETKLYTVKIEVLDKNGENVYSTSRTEVLK